MRKKAHYGFYGLPMLGLVSGVLITAGVLIGIFESIYPGALVALAGAYLITSYLIAFFLMERKARKSWVDISKYLLLKGDEVVLDVGCGLGRITIQAARHLKDGKVIGVDKWDRKIILSNSPKRAYSNAEAEGVRDRVEFRSGDLFKLEFPDNSFDAVTCSAVLTYSDRDKIFKAFSEIQRVLKPGGRFLLIEPLKEPHMFFLFSPFMYFKLPRKGRWLGLMDQAGFVSLRYTPWNGFGIFSAKGPARKK